MVCLLLFIFHKKAVSIGMHVYDINLVPYIEMSSFLFRRFIIYFEMVLVLTTDNEAMYDLRGIS